MSSINVELLRAQKALEEIGFRHSPPETLSLSEARRAADAIGEFLSEAEPPVAQEHWATIPGPHGPLPCRVYPAERTSLSPALIYFHGGGFALGNARGWDGMMRRLVRTCGVTIVNVDFRQSPEFRFPVAFEEAVFAIQFVSAHHRKFGIDPARLAVGGDSAGANLALAATCQLRDHGSTPLAMLLLFYGIYSAHADSPGWERENAAKGGLSRGTVEWMWHNYLADQRDRSDWRVAPLWASLHDLPYVYLVTGELDPLADDSRRLAEGLDRAGIENDLKIWPGLNHGFIRLDALAGPAAQALDDAAGILRQRLQSMPLNPIIRLPGRGPEVVYESVSLPKKR